MVKVAPLEFPACQSAVLPPDLGSWAFGVQPNPHDNSLHSCVLWNHHCHHSANERSNILEKCTAKQGFWIFHYAGYESQGEDNIYFLKLCGCCSQGGAGISGRHRSAAAADGLFVLQGAASSAQRGPVAREASECVGSGLCWLAFYRASAAAEISGDTRVAHAHSVNVWRHGQSRCAHASVWYFSDNLFLRARGQVGVVLTGSRGQKFRRREKKRSVWQLWRMKAEGMAWEMWGMKDKMVKMVWATLFEGLSHRAL